MHSIDRQIARYDRLATSYTRKRRKLYAELAAVDRRMEAVRVSNPCPDHAPTACRIIGSQLRELRVEWYRLTARIAAIEGDDPDLT